MRLASPIVVSFFLVGCAASGGSQTPAGWTKPGASQEVMDAEASECRGQAKSTSGGSDAAAAVATVLCLVSKGWRQAR